MVSDAAAGTRDWGIMLCRIPSHFAKCPSIARTRSNQDHDRVHLEFRTPAPSSGLPQIDKAREPADDVPRKGRTMMMCTLRGLRLFSILVALTLALGVFSGVPVRADSTFHTEQISLMAVNGAPLQSGFVVDIHTN